MESWRCISGGRGMVSFDEFSFAPTDVDSSSVCTGNQGTGLIDFQDNISTLNDGKPITQFDGSPFLLSIEDANESTVFGLHLGNQGYNPPCISKGSQVSDESSLSSKRLKIGADCKPSHCQVYGCYNDLTNSKEYHKKHKVCEAHSKSARAIVNGIEQRFCQQCSRFHLLCEFDDGKRSCRKRLAGHNERRRKPHLGRESRALQFYNANSLAPSLICPDILSNGIVKVERGFPRGLSFDEDLTSRLMYQPSSSSVRFDGAPPSDSSTAIHSLGNLFAHSLRPCQSSSRHNTSPMGSSHYSLAHVSTKLTELNGGNFTMMNSNPVELLPFIHRGRINQ